MTFKSELFQLPVHYEETPLCDRKAELYDLRNDERKAKFLQHVIAFANSARSIGLPARMLFGIANDGAICGLEESLEQLGYPERNETLMWEDIRKGIGQAIYQYIAPELSGFQLEHGVVEEKIVAYLLIPPTASRQRFRAKKDLAKNSKTPITTGRCWARFGESKLPVDPVEISPDDQEKPYWYSYAEIPYILPSYWIKYFDRLARDDQIIRAVRIVGYQDPLNSSGERMDAQLRHFMAGDERLWVIQGLAGIGKTAFMLRQLAGLIEGNAEAMYEIANREEFRGPPDWIPLYLSLRGQSIRNVNDLTDRLMDVVHASRAFWTGRRPNHPEHLLEYPELKWLIYCDGLDEIWSDVGQRNFLGALRHFLDRFPRLKVVLTTRPESVAQDWEQWPGTVLVRMAPMTQEMIRNYVSSQIVDEKAVERVQEIVDSLSASPDLWHLCSFPVCLEAAMKELADVYPQPLEDKTAEAKPVQVEGDVDTGVIETANTSAVEPVLPNMVDVSDLVVTEADPHLVNTTDQPNEEILPPIRPGRVVHGLYVRLWEREINRRAIRRAQTDSWWAGTGKLAIETDGQKPQFIWDDANRALGSARAVFWLLNLGIIDRTSQSGTLAYRTEITKAYFAASYIEQRSNNRQAQRLYQQTTASFRERMHSILEAISTNDLSHLSN